MKALLESLRALREADAELRAGKNAEETVLREFRRAVRRRRVRHAWIGAAALAASVTVALWMEGYKPAKPVPSRAMMPTGAAAPGTAAAPIEKLVSAAGRARKKGRAQRAAAPREPEVTTNFIPLTPGDVLHEYEPGGVIRVRLPRSAMRTFGFPVNEDRFDAIHADVVVGQDGSARAIRFVRSY